MSWLALALWDTDGQVEVVRDRAGVEQDLALGDPLVWPRVVAAAVSLGIRTAGHQGLPAVQLTGALLAGSR